MTTRHRSRSKRTRPFFGAILALALLGLALLACKSKAAPYKSEKDNFTITFPSGAKEPAVTPSVVLGDKDVTYSTTNGDGIYDVRVLKWTLDTTRSEPLQTKLEGAGVHLPLDDQTKEIKFQNFSAIESYGWQWSENRGPDNQLVKLQARVVAFQPSNSDQVFEISMKSIKQEALRSKDANAFFDSFALRAR